MMTVLEKSVGEADFALHRHSDERIGVYWEEHLIDEGYVPKDLREWSATLTLETDGCKVLAEIPCSCTSDGVAYADIPAATVDGLDPYTQGFWRIDGVFGDLRERIGDGHWKVVI